MLMSGLCTVIADDSRGLRASKNFRSYSLRLKLADHTEISALYPLGSLKKGYGWKWLVVACSGRLEVGDWAGRPIVAPNVRGRPCQTAAKTMAKVLAIRSSAG